jgi:hypothetical protein
VDWHDRVRIIAAGVIGITRGNAIDCSATCGLNYNNKLKQADIQTQIRCKVNQTLIQDRWRSTRIIEDSVAQSSKFKQTNREWGKNLRVKQLDQGFCAIGWTGEGQLSIFFL